MKTQSSLFTAVLLAVVLVSGCKRPSDPELPPDMPENAALRKQRLEREGAQAPSEPASDHGQMQKAVAPRLAAETATVVREPAYVPASRGSFFEPPHDDSTGKPAPNYDHLTPDNYPAAYGRAPKK